jgi:hypothetical protein
LAAASRQSPRVDSDPDEIQEAEPERDSETGELEREEVMASRKGGANTVLNRRRAEAAADPLDADELSTDRPADDPHDELLEPLFAAEQAEGYRSRWIAIQSSFVDDPSGAVRAGDELVAQVMSELANSFAGQRHRIESQLGDSRLVNTEDLRVALKSYRSFFERLLSL